MADVTPRDYRHELSVAFVMINRWVDLYIDVPTGARLTGLRTRRSRIAAAP